MRTPGPLFACAMPCAIAALVAPSPSPPPVIFAPRRPRAAGTTMPPPRAAAVADAPRGGDAERRSNDDGGPSPSKLESLLASARCSLDGKDADGAFAALAEAFGMDPTSSRIASMFEACLGLKVELAGERYGRWRDSLDASHDGGDAGSEVSEKGLNDLFQDRMGLSSLCIDGERYDEAGEQLRKAIEEATIWLDHSLQSHNNDNGRTIASDADFSSTPFRHWQPQIDRARYLLYRTNAACCQWDTYFEDGDRLRQSMRHDSRMLHPFDALKFPCVSLEMATAVARGYARRALEAAGVANDSLPKSNPLRRTIEANRHDPRQQLGREIRVGYVSPDFTSRHPLAFLMQHVFRHHDRSQFAVHVYSVSSSGPDDGPEVRAIREGSDCFTCLSPARMTPAQMYERMAADDLDVLVDLCGYAGTSTVAEVMASRAILRQDHTDDGRFARRLPVHVSYMGFPGSVGSAEVWDYSVFDRVVVPPAARRHYDEALVYMPHCYFVNSHGTAVGPSEADDAGRKALRAEHGLPPSAFVYCCHSRPDKIDPSTLRSWMRALARVRSEVGDANAAPSVLWLLRSGEGMERNLRRRVRREFGEDAEKCLVFADVAARGEHLRRLAAADVFLDTPAYNAHTLGCDALYAGVPMISLLRPSGRPVDDAADVDPIHSNVRRHGAATRSVATEKLASRVGASLLAAVGLRDDLVVPDIAGYEDAMVRCALDGEWFGEVRRRLVSSRDSSPLFDTRRWVRNLETAFRTMAGSEDAGGYLPDIWVRDDS